VLNGTKGNSLCCEMHRANLPKVEGMMKTTKEEKALLVQLTKTRKALFKALKSKDEGKLRKASAAAAVAIKNMGDFIKRRRIKRQQRTPSR
jgi:hypothetical protein